MTSSLVSYSVLEICETLPGMQNAVYRIEPSDGKTPVIRHVEDSFYYKPNAMDEMDMIHVASGQIVQSIEHMYRTSQIVQDVNAAPALFAIVNEAVTLKDLETKHAEKVKNVLRRQRNWFIKLVELADNDFAQYQRPQVVSYLQRVASRELNVKRPWNIELEDEGAKPDCAFCGSGLINPLAPVCPNCKNVINVAAYEALQKKVGAVLNLDLKAKSNA